MNSGITHVCPVCKHQRPVPKGTPATCNYCSEQMVPADSVAGRRALETKKETDK